MSLLHPESGLLIANRYELTQPLATGGMGEVWRGRDTLLDRPVAVKLLRREYVEQESFRQRFRAEARHAAKTLHLNIAHIFDYGESEQGAYLVMELVPGEPLSAKLAREGPLPPTVVARFIAQAAEGLQAAHESGLVHRDVKPGNLLITPTGTLKITDFGIARAGAEVPLTKTGEVMGTAQYLSPEQAQGEIATESSDIYS
ncbi:MAG: serine/threonine-protein kinase, partial [Angustibacter sp.]